MKRSLTLVSVVSFLLWCPGLFAQTDLPIATPNYGWLLIKTGFVLVGICFTAFIALKYVSKVHVRSQGPMKILGRLPIEGRRSVVVIDIAGKTLIVGNSEAGMHTLGELDGDQRGHFEKDSSHDKPSFKELLARNKNLEKTGGLVHPKIDGRTSIQIEGCDI